LVREYGVKHRYCMVVKGLLTMIGAIGSFTIRARIDLDHQPPELPPPQLLSTLPTGALAC
jgi:hypothetical protein